MTRQENIRFIVGAILSIVSAFILLALVSYLFTGAEDQKLFTDQGFEQYTAANWMGVWGAKLAHYMIENWFGVPSILIPIFLLATSIRVMRIYKVRLHKWFLNCMILMIWLSVFAAFVVQPLFNKSFINFGGQIGLTEVSLIRQRIGTPGVLAILFITAVMYLAYLSDEAISILRKALTSKATQSEDDDDSTELDESKIPPEQLISEEDFEVTAATPEAPFEDKAADTATTIEFSDTEPQPEHILKPFEQELPLDIEVSKPEEKMEIIVGKNPEEANLVDTRALEPYDPKLDLENYKYPTLDLLKKYDISDSGIDMDEQQQNKNRILKVLSNFGVDISSIKATIGPTITLYEITPAPGVRISKIRNLEDDIALSLSALGIRIIAPIPGKGTIGIEVPNAKPQVVSMESVINSRKFQETDYELPMALGKTITNEVFMVDLVKMPHLLVAGATGQGKSVGLNAIITSLLYKKHPAELKLVMVDPKKVEFSVYNPIVNHFLAQVEGNEDTEEPIITDVNKVIQTLKSLCVEMDTRYDLLKKARARNIKEYNQKFKNRELNPNNGHKFMPYIVVIIDEFGDLIMTSGKEIELPIARIAQLARAVGIHMIIATQRPTTNIITGTIKANFPARMAFKVSAMIDSRTILDRPGANQLVGKGDMLFLSGNEPVRVQCAFVDTPEVEKIVNFIADQQSYLRPFPLPEVALEGEEGGEGPDVDMAHLDPMFEDVARMVVAEQSGSTSMIQRKFSIGYNRAGRLMDQLEKAGIVGPAKGSKPREVLCISEDDLQFRLENLR
ncbi:MAG: DNA translocase FtsK 4TM domain-containing protein [Bacteroidaceae bacterium]|nr:DNA translocase FtsK 4TM domain-containing protein [Bacteroidaceae bacterium]MBR3546510.1 DNA translocase FtsK 4TM domain-containing protein [Bacteroidaceae bacterium]MBR4528330.1 DNA translocase FtsK 4TM domain-containing protein [Bacteroidaceae bacterium]